MITSKNNTTMAFSSNAPRFADKIVDESETFLGPGYYDIKSSFEERERERRRMQNQSAKLITGGAQSSAMMASQMAQIGVNGDNVRSAANLAGAPVRALPPQTIKKLT